MSDSKPIPESNPEHQFVEWFRSSSPYIHAHRGRTFVINFGGEAVESPEFATLIHDVALLCSLGARLVLVHGARPQIEARLAERGHKSRYKKGVRITDDMALACVKEAVGTIRVEIEALLSMGLSNTPQSGSPIRVTSGNFVTAKPLGIHGGTDFCHTGQIRRIDSEAINRLLDDGAIVLLSPFGYSPTGEAFNLSTEDVAGATAQALQADKLIYLVENPGLTDAKGRLIQQLTPAEAQRKVSSKRKSQPALARCLENAIEACRGAVKRAHLIGRQMDGSLLLELFTRDGAGTLITDETYEGIRQASIDDVGGILDLITPLEEEGVVVRRSRELLEMEIERFMVIERDSMIIACMALYQYQDRSAELACVAVHPDYRHSGRGDALLDSIQRNARKKGIKRLFVLTTQTAHWFQERGFQRGKIADLPGEKQSLYNYQRNSRVFVKRL